MRTTAADKNLRKLEELEQREGGLSGLTQFCRQMLALQDEAKSRFVVSIARFEPSVVSGCLSAGLPLVSFEDLSPGWVQAESLFPQVIDLLAREYPDFSGEVEGLKSIISNKPLLSAVARAWYEGSPLPDMANSVDSGVLASVIGTVFKPFLSAYAEALLPLVNQEAWRRRYCPICGSKPDFAFLETEVGARWLCCLRCDAQWLFQRLECPYCGNQKHASLAYLTDDKGLYRLYLCEECRSYVKAIDLRLAGPDTSLFVERIITMDIDSQAQQAGYKRGCDEPKSWDK